MVQWLISPVFEWSSFIDIGINSFCAIISCTVSFIFILSAVLLYLFLILTISMDFSLISVHTAPRFSAFAHFLL